MKKYIFEAYVKDENSAKNAAKNFLKDFGENPENFIYEIKKVKYYTYKIICKKI